MVNEFELGSSSSPAAEFRNNSETNDVTGFKTPVSKRIKLSSDFNQSGGELSSSEQSSVIGLTLRKTPSLLNLVGMVLSQLGPKNDMKQASSSSQVHNEAKMNDFSCKTQQQVSEKLKASNFRALSLKIGNFERFSRYEEELVAKYYYAKKKIVWELLEGPVKSKIEIQWSDVEAIRGIIHANEPGILEIELNQPPSFYKETNPQPRKHTLWQPTSDFTNGEALKFRRHSVHFPPGTLDKHYEKLLQCDPRLLELSQKPFPTGGYPYFRPEFYPCNISFDRQQTTIPSSLVQPQHLNLKTQFQVLNNRQQDGDLNVGMFRNQREENWTRNENISAWDNQMQRLIPSVASNTQQEIDPINIYGTENDMLWDKQFAYRDCDEILARGNLMCSLADTPYGVNDMGIDLPENIQGNIVHSGKSQICKYNDGMVNSFSSQASDDYTMMMNYYYQNGLPNQKVENYEYLDFSYTDQQWS